MSILFAVSGNYNTFVLVIKNGGNMEKFGMLLRAGRFFLVFLWATALLVSSCKKDDEPNYTETNKIVQSIMYYYYYWNYKIDGKIETSSAVLARTQPDKYFESLLYDKSMAPSGTKEYDRWSFMVSYKEFYDVMIAGEYKSYGYFLDQASDYSIRVCFVYEGSPIANAGIERGYKLLKLDGKDVQTLIANRTINEQLNRESNRFVFADREGKKLPEMDIAKAVVKINPILKKERYNINGKEVGYIIYNSFITESKKAIAAALQDFQDVDEFIFDLRYNGGGDVSAADTICEHLLPVSAGSESIDFSKYVFSERTNQETKYRDEVYQIKRNENAMNLSRLFVIVSDMTASASEGVINCMKPFVDEVILVGTKTEGKPTGMNGFVDDNRNPQWAILPITFRIDNVDDEGSYFNGLEPDFEISDDLYHDFGVDESCLRAVLKYIETGIPSTSKSAKSVGGKKTPRMIQLKGLQIHAGCL
jgi:C-terminal processing protease CtpA/Prc